jgi:PLP dependent protein
MPIDTVAYHQIKNKLLPTNTTLVAVSKTKPAIDIEALYSMGQKHFGENYVQELVAKQAQLPQDICWHFIGHLQSNKVKLIAGFVHLIHAVDSMQLLQEINKQAIKNNRTIDCLLQVHIAQEETKFGFDICEIEALNFSQLAQNYKNVNIVGIMAMASFSNNAAQINKEFADVANLFISIKKNNKNFTTLSIGMSQDYEIALQNNSTLVRIGSLLFGSRNV